MLKKVQIFKALDIEIKKQKGPAAVKDAYKGHHSLKEELSQPGITIIAEVAGGNPIRGQVRDGYRASTHAKSLMENGAKAISVATDRFVFFGEDRHLSEVRGVVKAPLIRQDFIFEEYQVEESKILGADAVMFLANLLDLERLMVLQKLAKSKSLDVVVEVTNEAELALALEANADIICVLGRDLDSWEPRWEEAIALMKKVPESRCLRVMEAGISNLEQIRELESLGVHGVIVGDALLDEFYPGKRLAQILSGVEVPKKPVKVRARQESVRDLEIDDDSDGVPVLKPAKAPKAPRIVSARTEKEAAEAVAPAEGAPAPKARAKARKAAEMKPEVEAPEAAVPEPVEPKAPEPKKAAPKKAEPKKPEPKKPEPGTAEADQVEPKPSGKKKPESRKAEPKTPEPKQAQAKQAEPKAPEAKPAGAKQAEPKAPEAKPAGAKKAEPKAPEAKPAGTKKAEPKAPEAKPASTKKAEPKAPEAKPASAKKAEPKAPEAKPAGTKKAEPKTPEAKQAGTKKAPKP